MESMATLGCPAYGYGIRYEHGLFRQRFEAGQQVETPEDWLNQSHPWEFARPEAPIRSPSRAMSKPSMAAMSGSPAKPCWPRRMTRPSSAGRANGPTRCACGRRSPRRCSTSTGSTAAITPQRPSPRRWRARCPRALPGRHHLSGQGTAPEAGILPDLGRAAGHPAPLLARHSDLRALPKHVAIQMNDTHPAIAGPELIRLLVDEHGMAFDEALPTARGCLGYTNHTLLPEALERWATFTFGNVLPRHMQIVERIDSWHRRTYPSRPALRGHREAPRGADGRACLHHGAQGERRLGAAFRSGEEEPVPRTAPPASGPDHQPDQRRHAAPLAQDGEPPAGQADHRHDRRGLGGRSRPPQGSGTPCDIQGLPRPPSARPSAPTRWRCRTGSPPNAA
jgi:hypothetical protein